MADFDQNIKNFLSLVLQASDLETPSADELFTKEKFLQERPFALPFKSLVPSLNLSVDKNGKELPTEVRYIPLEQRAVLPTQTTTFTLKAEWFDIINTVINSVDNYLVVFAVDKDQGSKSNFNLNNLPKTGTLVHLLQVKAEGETIEVICEGIQRVWLNESVKPDNFTAQVYYPEILYNFLETKDDELAKKHSQELIANLQELEDRHLEINLILVELMQRAQYAGIQAQIAPEDGDIKFYLINDKNHIGRLSKEKIDAFFGSLGLSNLKKSTKLQFGKVLACPSESLITFLMTYKLQLKNLVEKQQQLLLKICQKADLDLWPDLITSLQIYAFENPLFSLDYLETLFKTTPQYERFKHLFERDYDTLMRTKLSRLLNSVNASSALSSTIDQSQSDNTLSKKQSLLEQTQEKTNVKKSSKDEVTLAEPNQEELHNIALEDVLAEHESTRHIVTELKQDPRATHDENINKLRKLFKQTLSEAKVKLTPHDSNIFIGNTEKKLQAYFEKFTNSTQDSDLYTAINNLLTESFSDFSELENESTQDVDVSQKEDASTATESNDATSTNSSKARQTNKNSSKSNTLSSIDSKSFNLQGLMANLYAISEKENLKKQERQARKEEDRLSSLFEDLPMANLDGFNIEENAPNFGVLPSNVTVIALNEKEEPSADLLEKIAQAKKTIEDEVNRLKQTVDHLRKQEQSTDKYNNNSELTNEADKTDTSVLSKNIVESNNIKIDPVEKLNALSTKLENERLDLKSFMPHLMSYVKNSSNELVSLQQLKKDLIDLIGGNVIFSAVNTKKDQGQDFKIEIITRAYSTAILATLQELLPLHPLMGEDLKQYLSRMDFTDPSTLADCAASLCLSRFDEAQQVLDKVIIVERLPLVLSFLTRELSSSKIREGIKEQITEKLQFKSRRAILREQLNMLKQELDDDEENSDAQKFRMRIAKLDAPEHIKKRVENELKRLEIIDSASMEYSTIYNYLDILTTVPWGIYSLEQAKALEQELANEQEQQSAQAQDKAQEQAQDKTSAKKDQQSTSKKAKNTNLAKATPKIDLKEARQILDRDHEGLQDVKDRIIEFLAVSSLKGDVSGQIMLFVGPPGVGKTSIGKSIAEALHRPFYRLALGGIDDVSEIKGHRKTYVGAMPGKFVTALRESKCMNPVIMLDEIDKLGRSYHGDPGSALLETLDPEQNTNFLDLYLDERLDLSKCLFICTANSTDTIPGPLLDRMEPIRIAGYIAKEKFDIAKNHLIPKAMQKSGIEKKALNISDETLMSLIEGYARESGVRSLERNIDKLLRKVAVKLVEGQKKVILNKEHLEDYLGTAPFKKEKHLSGVGIMTGLAWTASGGVTLPVESIVTNNSTAGFKLTGSLGDVMKESANIAFSFMQSNLGKYTSKANSNFFKKQTIHLHVPEGAIPKDGPSAGITMASALLSLALNTPPLEGIAMTGELTLTGHVLPIGGLKEKVIAARRMGIFTLVIPKGNEGDVHELPTQVSQGVTFYYADTFDDVAYVLFPEVQKLLIKNQQQTAPISYCLKETKAEEQPKETKPQNKAKVKSKGTATAKTKTKLKASAPKTSVSSKNKAHTETKEAVSTKDTKTVRKALATSKDGAIKTKETKLTSTKKQLATTSKQRKTTKDSKASKSAQESTESKNTPRKKRTSQDKS